MTIQFTTPEFHASIAEVRRSAARLSSARSRAAGEVSSLLDGWHGVAATEFAEAWSDWLGASASVVSALSGLGDALVMFQTDITLVDSSAGSALDVIARRLS